MANPIATNDSYTLTEGTLYYSSHSVLANDTYSCGAINMLTFNGTTAFGELSDIWVSTDDDWTIQIVFQGIATSSRFLVDSNSGDATRLFIYNVAGGIAWQSSLTEGTFFLDGAGATWGPWPDDNELHTLKFIGSAQASISHIGSTNSGSAQYNGIIKSVTLTDLTTPANSRTYTLDSGSILYELPDGEVVGSELWTHPDYITTGLESTFSIINAITVAEGTVFAYTFSVSGLTEGQIRLVDGSSILLFTTVDGVFTGVSTVEGLNSISTRVGTSVPNANATISLSIKELPKALIYNNVIAADWEEYTYNATSADCSNNPGWEHETESTICIAQ